jgi:hypothetical protein
MTYTSRTDLGSFFLGLGGPRAEGEGPAESSFREGSSAPVWLRGAREGLARVVFFAVSCTSIDSASTGFAERCLLVGPGFVVVACLGFWVGATGTGGEATIRASSSSSD